MARAGAWFRRVVIRKGQNRFWDQQHDAVCKMASTASPTSRVENFMRLKSLSADIIAVPLIPSQNRELSWKVHALRQRGRSDND